MNDDSDYNRVPLKIVRQLECRDAGSAATDHALIRQLGEALVVLDKIYIERVYLDALKSYNDWKARQP